MDLNADSEEAREAARQARELVVAQIHAELPDVTLFAESLRRVMLDVGVRDDQVAIAHLLVALAKFGAVAVEMVAQEHDDLTGSDVAQRIAELWERKQYGF